MVVTTIVLFARVETPWREGGACRKQQGAGTSQHAHDILIHLFVQSGPPARRFVAATARLTGSEQDAESCVFSSGRCSAPSLFRDRSGSVASLPSV